MNVPLFIYIVCLSDFLQVDYRLELLSPMARMARRLVKCGTQEEDYRSIACYSQFSYIVPHLSGLTHGSLPLIEFMCNKTPETTINIEVTQRCYKRKIEQTD